MRVSHAFGVILLSISVFVEAQVATGSLTGRIIEPGTGQGLGNVTVQLGDVTGFYFIPSEKTGPVATDANGHYRIDNIPFDTGYSVIAYAPFRERRLHGNGRCGAARVGESADYCNVLSAPRINIVDSETIVLPDIGLDRAARLIGSVRDNATHQPVVEAALDFHASNGKWSTWVQSGDGYALDHVWLDTYRPLASAPGYLTTDINGEACAWYTACQQDDPALFAITQAVEIRLDWLLERAAELAVVRTSFGRPIDAGYVVKRIDHPLQPERPGAQGELAAGQYAVRFSDPGIFRPEAFDDIACDDEDCSTVTPDAVTLVGGTVTIVEAELTALSSISGVVTDDVSGQPIAGVVAVVREWYDNPFGGWQLAAEVSATTDGNGRYAIGGLRPGVSYELDTRNAQHYVDERYPDVPCMPNTICPPSNGPPSASAGYFQIPTGGSIYENIDIALAKGGAIAGRLSAKGLPVSGAVFIRQESTQLESFLVDSKGEYLTRTGLPAGDYHVLARSGDEFRLFDGVRCASLNGCSLDEATLVTVAVGNTTEAIDFDMTPAGDAIFASGFDE